MVEIQVAYQGQLRCQSTHVPSGQTLLTDAPVDNHGKGEAFSPTDLVAAALGSCMLTILGIVAPRHDINPAGATVKVIKDMTTVPTRRIGRLTVDMRILANPSDTQRQAIENAIHACPVLKSLHPDIEVPVTIRWGK